MFANQLVGRQANAGYRTHPRMKAVIGTALSGLNSKDNAALAKKQLVSSIGPRPNGRT